MGDNAIKWTPVRYCGRDARLAWWYGYDWYLCSDTRTLYKCRDIGPGDPYTDEIYTAHTQESAEEIMRHECPPMRNEPFNPHTEVKENEPKENEPKENPKHVAGNGRLDMTALPIAGLLSVTRVMDGGVRKYGYQNYTQTRTSVRGYLSATMRHIFRVMAGEWIDPESGEPHVSHIAADGLILADAHYRQTIKRDHAPALPEGQLRALLDTSTLPDLPAAPGRFDATFEGIDK